MILTYWLDQPVWLMFVLLAVLILGASALICVVSTLRATRPAMLRLGTGIVAPYFNAVSVLLALLAGFVASDSWERHRQASRIVQTERANAMAVHDLSLAAASDMRDIRSRLAAYLDAVTAQEWPLMAETGEAAPQAGTALGALLQAVADPAVASGSGDSVQQTLLDAVMALRNARGERLALANATDDQSKWLNLLALTALTLVAIGLIHLDKPAAQATTLVLFSLAVITTLGVVALHARPFDGPMAVSDKPLIEARAAIQ